MLISKRAALISGQSPARMAADIACQVASSLSKRGISVKLVELPNLPWKGDVSDWLTAGGTKEDLLKICAEAPFWQPQSMLSSSASLQTIKATDLMKKDFPEPRWAIKPILPEGLTVRAGPPKVGKSWMAFALACSVAAGGIALNAFPANQGKVFYLALEDNLRRLQERLKKLSEQDKSLVSENLELSCSIKRLDEGGAEELSSWLDANLDCRLVIDTFGRISAEPNGRRNAYDNDYRGLAPLQKLAIDRQIALVLITHTRKEAANDPLASVMGSTGITGVADAVWLLNRGRTETEGTLLITGRDLEEREYVLELNAESCQWNYLGEKVQKHSEERQAIINVLRESNCPLGPKAVAEALNKSETNTKSLMKKMHDRGDIERVERGKYTANHEKENRSLRSLSTQEAYSEWDLESDRVPGDEITSREMVTN